MFGIADNILVLGHDIDSKDHNENPLQVLQKCRHVNLKLNKDKCCFRCTLGTFYGEVISRHCIQPNSQKLKALMEMSPPKTKRELQAFLRIINYLGKFSPSTADHFESLRKLMSTKTEWTWNATYQIFDKVKLIIKDACMKFYDEMKPLYIKIDAFWVALAAALLQIRNNNSCPMDEATDNIIIRPIAFTSKSLTREEKRYRNIERESLCIL